MKSLATKTTVIHRAHAGTSAEAVMTRNPLSINESATLHEAAGFLTAKGISAAPVINPAGRPVGVLSLADIVRCVCVDKSSAACLRTAVREVMTPVVFFVRPNTPVGSVIDDLLTCAVHRLFVVDENEVLVGVISTLDLLHFLKRDTNIPSSTSPRRAAERRRVPARVLDHRKPVMKTPETGSDIVVAGAGG
jgi:CBS domain-containing protein